MNRILRISVSVWLIVSRLSSTDEKRSRVRVFLISSERAVRVLIHIEMDESNAASNRLRTNGSWQYFIMNEYRYVLDDTCNKPIHIHNAYALRVFVTAFAVLFTIYYISVH